MGTNLKTICGLLAALAIATPAVAQGTYVSASLVGDIARFSHVKTDGGTDFSGGGEAIGFALRLGTPIGSNWGVEAEFARPSEITQEGQPGYIPLVTSAFSWSSSTIVPGAGPTVVSPIDTFPFGYNVKTSQRLTTFSTSAWVRQTFTDRVALVYLGGLGFLRTTQRSEVTFTFPPRLTPSLPGVAPTILPPQSISEFVDYGVRPLVGVDARIGLTEHVELVPSLRLTGLQSGWLIRPSVGLGWTF
jgi:hypothetical protein